MGRLLNLVTPLHKRTARDYLGRMNDDKIDCMKTARKFDRDFWDGDRRFGYGGYSHDGRWKAVAQGLIDTYRLPADAKILDVGCGKGFLLYEFTRLLPRAEVRGFDISTYAVEHAKPEIRDRLSVRRAEDAPYPFDDKAFDLVISITTLHNLVLNDLALALNEIERVGKNKYIVMESYRNEAELFNLECWALTAESFFRPGEWEWLFAKSGFTGDYEFIYFE